jgi:hypothetical protein
MAEQAEFRFLGQTAPNLTIAYGLFLVLWGAAFFLESSAITAAIPGFIGLPILISGLLTRAMPAKRKIWMHVAVLFGLLAFLGGFAILKGLGSEAGMFARPNAAISQLMLLVTGGVYTVTCVRSFIWARKNRAAETTEG